AMPNVPVMMSGLRPQRVARGSSVGLSTKRPATIAACARSAAGTDTPACSRNTMKKIPPAPCDSAWMPECRLTRLIASLRRNAMRNIDEERWERERPAQGRPGEATYAVMIVPAIEGIPLSIATYSRRRRALQDRRHGAKEPLHCHQHLAGIGERRGDTRQHR